MFRSLLIKLALFQLTLHSFHSETFQSMLVSQMEANFSLGISLGQCLSTIGSNFFDLGKDIILIEFKNQRTLKIPKFGVDLKNNLDWTFYTAELYFLPNIFHCYDKNYILEIGSYEEVLRAFQIIKLLNCWNPNQRIFIFSSAIKENQSAEFLEMVSLTQKQMLSNVVVMLPTKERKLSFQIYYWSSQDNEKCVDKPMYPHFFRCKLGNVSAFQDNHEGPSECSLKVKAVVSPPFVVYKGKNTFMASDLTPIQESQLGGVEIELMNLISKLMKIEVQYYVSTKEDWGRSFFNGSTTKSMEDLTTKKVDIVVGSLTTSLSRYLLFETTMPYSEENLVCCVPHQIHFEMYSAFLDTSSLNVYFSIYLIYVLLTSVVWFAAQFSRREFQIYKKGPSVFLYTFAAIIGNSVSTLPKSRRVRMFFLMLLIFQFFYVAFYQSLLTSELSTQKFDEEIKTIEDIFKRNMNIYNQPDNHRYFEYEPKKIGEMISKHWINCDNTTKCLENLYKSKKEAICLDEGYKDYITQNSRREGRSSLYCLKRKILWYPVVMIMRKSLPLRKTIDRIIGRVVAAGLVDKWMSSLFLNSSKVSLEVPKALTGILGFSHLKPVFVLVGVGYSFAWLVLVVEILYFLYSKSD